MLLLLKARAIDTCICKKVGAHATPPTPYRRNDMYLWKVLYVLYGKAHVRLGVALAGPGIKSQLHFHWRLVYFVALQTRRRRLHVHKAFPAEQRIWRRRKSFPCISHCIEHWTCSIFLFFFLKEWGRQCYSLYISQPASPASIYPPQLTTTDSRW